LSHGESENNQHAAKTLTSSGHEHDRDFLQDFWQATVDLHSYLSKAQAHQQHDVNVPTDALQTLLNGVETIRRIQNLQEKRSVASLYIGTILGALIGVVGNFFVSFWFLTQSWWNTLGLTVSFVLLLFVCIALFLQAKKYAE
jgi:hypothetical protein